MKLLNLSREIVVMRFRPLQLLAAVILATASVASADVINFSLVGPGDFSSYTEQGVTFTATAGTKITSQDFGTTPNGTFGLISKQDGSGNFSPLKAVITGGASSVSIDLGDFDQDPDGLFLQVYNSSNVLIDSSTLTTLASDSTMHTLTLTDPGIAYAIFGSGPPSVSGSSVFADNFTWTPAAVPEPTSVILLLTLLLAVAIVARKQIAQGL